MNIKTLNPEPHLKNIVSRFWYIDLVNYQMDNQPVKILANGSPGIIMQHQNGNSTVRDLKGGLLPISFVYGQSITPCVNHISGNPFIFGVDFVPTAIKRVFGFDASILTDSIVSIEDLVGKSFADQLINIQSVESLINLFSKFLYQKINNRYKDAEIEKSIRLGFLPYPDINYNLFHNDLNISLRQFQRKFKFHVGLCHETYLRIIKFQKSIQLMHNYQFNKLGDIGHQLGYTDQSYFNREFKFFSGYTPKGFLKRISEPQLFFVKHYNYQPPWRILQE